MKGFEYRFVVVELSQRCIESNKEGIVDTGMPNIMADGGDQESQSVKRLQQSSYRRYWLVVW